MNAYNPPIPRAAYTNDPEGLEETLKNRRAYHKDLDTLARGLQLVAQKGFADCARVFLKAGAIPDFVDKDGNTPLVLACQGGHYDVVELLLERGVKVNKTCHRTRATGLHWACAHNHLECVELLLKAGANVNAVMPSGTTPLMMAVRSDHDDILKLLIKNNANLKVLDSTWKSALHLACAEGAYDCVNVLLNNGCEADAADFQGDTPFHLAIRGGHTQVVKRLIRAGCSASKHGKYNLNTLHMACDKGATQIVRLLLSCLIDPDEPTMEDIYTNDYSMESGMTPLMIACKKGHADTVKVLIEYNINLTAFTSGCLSALHLSCKYGHLDCARLLLEKGVCPDPNITDLHQYDDNTIVYEPTALFLATGHDHPAVVAELLKAGADPDLFCYHNMGRAMTPLLLAAMKGYNVMVRLMLCAGANIHNLRDETLIHNNILTNMDLVSWIQEYNSTPQTLKHQSRLAIRKLIGYFPNNKIVKLPLPEPIHYYLKLDEFSYLI